MYIFLSEKIKRNLREEAGEGDWREEERGGGGEKPERHGWWCSKQVSHLLFAVCYFENESFIIILCAR